MSRSAKGSRNRAASLRDFLHFGFNQDVKGKIVFDGMMPIVAAGRGTWVNAQFSQPGRWSKEHDDHFTPGFQFPFAYNVITDPVSGATDGLLKQCLATQTCPKIMQVDGEFEWWGGGASLVVTDGAGKDLSLPPNVRYYLVAGTRHVGGNGITTGLLTMPDAGSVCQLPNSEVGGKAGRAGADSRAGQMGRARHIAAARRSIRMSQTEQRSRPPRPRQAFPIWAT